MMVQHSLSAVLLSFMVLTSAHAALPELPADAMGDDVVGVLWIDAQRVDAAQLATTIDNTMGRFAKPVNEAMAQYARLHAPFVRAGGTSLAIVYFDPFSANSASRGVANPVFLFSTGDNANRAAIESIVEQVSLDEKNKPRAKFEMLGKWLMAYDGTLARPYMEKGAAERVDALRTALEPIGTSPAVLAFVPSKRMRFAYQERMGLDPKTPRDQLVFVRSLVECRSLTVTATLGSQPALNAVARMADAEAATQLVEVKKPLLETLNQFMKQRDMRGVAIELITQLATYHGVLANNNLEVNRNLVTLSMSGPTLVRTAEAIAGGLAMARDEALIVRSLNQMKALIVALNSYAEDNRGQYPAKLEDLGNSSYVKDLDKLLINPLTGQTPGYVYVRPSVPLNTLVKEKRTARTPILYEARDGRINPRGLIGYVNGHVERTDIRE